MFKTKIIQQCLKGNRKAQLQLYNKYCDAMLKLAYRYLQQQDLAEDAMQEAFIKAFKNLHKYDGSSTFGAWLKRIVIHQAIDDLRKNIRFLELDENSEISTTDEHNWEVEDHCAVEDVKHALEQLPEKYKLVLKLFLMEGYDHEEISEILGISINASRTQLHRGKILLKAELKHRNYERFA
ncbi:RNA polymerase sigma factor [Psychroflexus aestuariivivens]|uniref:RNA polymerase sigma factor n=1 Tax=Psychroflexus aestuariivivens TaxID=1795040 RepID=UPI000FD9730E|nr:RNA polymerase sigma factor [Psychroflexus aestuariivivens]